MIEVMCKIHERIKWVATPDGGVLLDPHKGTYFSVNPVGAAIVTDLLSGIPSERIVDRLLERYPVTADLARDGYAKFLMALRAKQICEGA